MNSKESYLDLENKKIRKKKKKRLRKLKEPREFPHDPRFSCTPEPSYIPEPPYPPDTPKDLVYGEEESEISEKVEDFEGYHKEDPQIGEILKDYKQIRFQSQNNPQIQNFQESSFVYENEQKFEKNEISFDEEKSKEEESPKRDEDLQEEQIPHEEPPQKEQTAYEEEPTELAIKGIKNPGFDCFMISALQCLMSIPEFVHYFCHIFERRDHLTFSSQHQNDYEMSHYKPKYCSKLQDFMIRYIYSESYSVSAKKFRPLFEREFPSSYQHDASKFILFLFEKLQKELNDPTKSFVSTGFNEFKDPWIAYSQANNSIIDELFVGMYETIMECEHCRDGPHKYEEFKNIPIQCYVEMHEFGFQEFLDLGVDKEPIQMYCKQCHVEATFLMYKKIIHHPKYLILTFQRFSPYTNSKIEKYMNYESEFTLPSNNGSDEVKYSLFSVVLHSGGLQFGHYTSICKRGKDWLDFNDSSVDYTKDNNQKDPDAYILFYKRHND
ncbi:unnamed protein product [Moneuplotes crassus]|uniref:USP domain-containing protein n=1 Tax=Euplotes crassus TaxID=5936 RepID=A0AAD1UDW7_EUPCR|nr:unnamed protein product [Moneuplotes crassus]